MFTAMLKRFGKTGETAGWIAALLDSHVTWAGIVSLGLGGIAALTASLFAFFSDPRIQVAIGVFMACLWTYIGLRILHSYGAVSRVAVEPDYRYCLSREGYQLGYDNKATDLAFSVSFGFRNVCTAPIHLKVEEFRILIGDRTCGDPEKEIDLVVPRVAQRILRSGGFSKDVMKEERNSGTLSVSIVYGPADGKFVRRYRFKTKLQFAFMRDPKGEIVGAAVSEESFTEEDFQINTPG